MRYRATYPLQYLRDQTGITYSLVYPGYGVRNILRFLTVFFSVLLFRRRHSALVFQKIYTKGIYATALKLLLFFRPRRTLYDIDDAEHTRRPAETIHYFMKRCTACTAGSRALVEYARAYNKNPVLLTSPVIAHGHQKAGRESVFTVGWVGYYGAHRESLMTLFFPALLQVDFPVRLVLLGVDKESDVAELRAFFEDAPQVSVETPLRLNWLDEASIYDWIKTFDVGISPLLNTEFNRAKSAFKLKQCLSCGVPVLATPVGENRYFLADGQVGYLCDSPADFAARLAQIWTMQPADYARFCASASASFPQFSVAEYCGQLVAILSEL